MTRPPAAHTAGVRLATLLLVGVVGLAGCSEPATDSAPEQGTPGASAAHPCDVVSDEEAAELLGSSAATGNRIDTGEQPGGEATAVCQFVGEGPQVPGMTLQTSVTEDFDGLVSLFSAGGDRVRPIEVAGAEDAVLVVDRDEVLDIVTVAAASEGEVHLAVVDAPTQKQAIRVATGAVELLVAG